MFWKLTEPKPNGPLAAQLFLDILGVKLSATTLQNEVEDHPDYPSLLSISDVFSRYNIENVTASFSPDQMDNIPPPYITQLKKGKNEVEYFTVISDIFGETARMFDPEERKWIWTSLKDLKKISTGIVLLAEPTPDAGEPDYKQKHREETIKHISRPTLATLLLIILGITIGKSFIYTGPAALLPVIHFLTAVTGVGLGILLVWYELDRYSPVIRQICKATKKVNCNAILQSDAAKIGGISWSVIGLSYFIGTVLFFQLNGLTNPAALALVGLVSILSFPFTIYSVFYQWRIAKQWCILCLYVQGLLVLQAAITLTGGWMTHLISGVTDTSLIFSAITSYILPLLVLLLSIPVLKKAKNAGHSKHQLNRLKYDPIIFDALLKKQKAIRKSAEGVGIVLGTPGAANKIIKVCNPYCDPCAQAHVPIEELIQNNPDVELRIIFTATTEDSDIKRLPVGHFLSIAALKDDTLMKQALDDWYLASEKNYEAFAAKYPVSEDLTIHNSKISAMRMWCDVEEISGTPTIFINDHELPQLYSAHDLKNFFIA